MPQELRPVFSQDIIYSIHISKYKFGYSVSNLLRLFVKLLNTCPGYKNIQTLQVSTEFKQTSKLQMLSSILDGPLKTSIMKKKEPLFLLKSNFILNMLYKNSWSCG